MLKVVIIGGGSSYTPELIEGFIKRYSELPITELHLIDVEEGKEKLNIIYNLSKRMIEKYKLPIKIFSSLDRKSALKDADFVITQFRVGRLEARILDERIPLSHGVIGQETNGAGGIFKALRTIPVMQRIVEDIKLLCPNAWLINFTNPAGIITEAIYNHMNFKKVVGLCNGPVTMKNAIAKLFEIDSDRITLSLVGLNHHNFITNIFVDGESKMDDLLKLYVSLDENELINMKNIMAFPWSKALIRGLKCIPSPYLSYYYFTKEQLEYQIENYKKHTVRAEIVKEIENKLFEIYKNPNLDVKPKELEGRGGSYYSDAACSLINSIYNNKMDIQYVNSPNMGAISNFDDNDILELAAIITKDGPKPIALGRSAEIINGTIQSMKSFEKILCEAAMTGNKDLTIAAMTINPLIPSDKLSNILFDELYEAHKKYLPQFEEGDK